jgi:hypothetical protein
VSKKKTDASSIIARLRYEPFDGAKLEREKSNLLDDIKHRRTFHELTDKSVMAAADFSRFALLNEIGWGQIFYESHLIQGGMMYWMTDVHAEAIGRALRPTLKYLRLDLTMPEGDGFTVMANAASAELRLEKLCVAHRAADAVTQSEARGLARLATKLGVTSLSLWAAEFDEGALDALAEELALLGNTRLKEVDICDLTKEEPDDKVTHVGLTELVQRNAKA